MKSSVKKDGGVLGEHHGNGNGVEPGLLVTGEALHLETSDAETHEHGSDCEHEHLGNSSLETSYVEESLETTEEASLEVTPTGQEHVEEPEEIVRPHSPEFIDRTEEGAASGEELEQGQAKDVEIADIVGLLESTSFTSKHILQGSDGSVTSESRTPGSDNERRGIGEIPDEE